MHTAAAAKRRRTTPPQDGGQHGNPPTSESYSSEEEVLTNDDLVSEILLRLPPKSLIRFKSVSKKWLSLISDDDFCLRHTLRRPKLPVSLILRTQLNDLYYLDPIEKTLTPYALTTDPRYKICRSCNGLLLLCSRFDVSDTYYVHNPTTKKSRCITLPNSNDDYLHVAWIGLVFDPRKSPFYKIVCIRSTTPALRQPPQPPICQNTNQIQNQAAYAPALPPPPPPPLYRIEIYDSEFHKWRVTEEPVIHSTRSFYSDGVHWNDVVYCRSSAVYCRSSCFDLVRKEIKMVPCAHPLTEWSKMGTIDFVLEHVQEFDGRLYFVELGVKGKYESLANYENQALAVWEMGNENSSAYWLLKHQYLLEPHPATLTPRKNCVSVLGFMDACTILTCEVGKIRVHNFVERSYEDIVDLTKKDFYLRNYGTFSLTGFQVGETMALV